MRRTSPCCAAGNQFCRSASDVGDRRRRSAGRWRHDHRSRSRLRAVLAAANAGDPAASDVLAQAGSDLAGRAIAVTRRLFRTASEIPVAMSGGVFQNAALVREHFYKSLRSEYPNASINETVVEPVRGALELARRGTAP